ncbi:MAG: tryptophan synthase subunit alpha [Ignavibacteriaceae bacterium]
MSIIADYISKKNKTNEKVLSIFLTAGFPDKDNFVDLALKILDSGADMLEIGFPFSDPLADGPVIQHSSQIAIENGINLNETFILVRKIREGTDKPLIMMGYANPVLSYGVNKFTIDAKTAGVNGVIIPDVPIEEYDNFFNGYFEGLDTILLITPTTSNDRIKLIDENCSGFLYCVSVSGTTGAQQNGRSTSLEFIKRTNLVAKKNNTLVGFGISNENDARAFAPYCNGIIVGSAVIKSLMNDDKLYSKTLELVTELKRGLSY